MGIYLDNGATTKIYKEAIDEMSLIMEEFFGNPSSLHSLGKKSFKKLLEYREFFAKSINASINEIVFTSGGSEGNNQVINTFDKEKNKIITTEIDHSSVLNTLKEKKCETIFAKIDKEGKIDMESLLNTDISNVKLVIMSLVNGEIGTIQNVKEITKKIKEKNPEIKVLVDAVQGYGKIPIDVKDMNIDYLTTSGHKVHGPRGIGFLYIKSGSRLEALIFGGGQENNKRSGTENLASIGAFKASSEKMIKNMDENFKYVENIKREFIKKLKENFDVIINSPLSDSFSPYILNTSFKGASGEVLLRILNDSEIYVSTGSACSSKTGISKVIKGIKTDKDYAKGTVRFSFSKDNKIEEIETVIEVLKEGMKFFKIQ